MLQSKKHIMSAVMKKSQRRYKIGRDSSLTDISATFEIQYHLKS